MPQQTKVSFPFPAILTLIFITLKLTGHITWSWLWVLSPMWITFVVVFVLMIIVFASKGYFSR